MKITRKVWLKTDRTSRKGPSLVSVCMCVSVDVCVCTIDKENKYQNAALQKEKIEREVRRFF